MKQKALNVAVALAFGAVAAPSLAGTISVTPRQFPASIFGNPALSVAPVAYSISAPLATGVTRYLYVQLDGGATFAPGLVNAADFKVLTPSGTTPTGTVIGAPVYSADNTFVYVPITTGSNPPQSTDVPAPINSTITFTPEAGSVTTTSALATPGSKIDAIVSLGNNPSTSATAGDADAASTGAVAISVNPFTVTVVSSGASSAPFGPNGVVGDVESQKIDVVTAATGKNGIEFTQAPLTFSTTAIDFGSFKVALVPNLFKADGTQVTSPTQVADKLSFTISGTFNAFVDTKDGAFFDLSTSAFGPSSATAATTITPTTITFSGLTVGAVGGAPTAGTINVGTQYYFVAGVDDATPIDTTTPVVSNVTFTQTGGGSSTSTPSSTSLYALGPNGGIVDIPTYIPAGVGGGYTSYFRVINSGSLPAAPAVQVITEQGVAGTSPSLGFTIPAGGAHIFSSSDIEAVTGAISPSTRPRLRFTAPTSLVVQTLVINPDGTLTTLDTYNTAPFSVQPQQVIQN